MSKNPQRRSKLVPSRVDRVKEHVRSPFSLLLSYTPPWQPVFHHHVRWSEYFHASSSPEEQMLPGWIATCPCLLVHHRMSYGRTGVWPRNKYLLAECVLAWTWSECALWQITLEIIVQISAQGGEWRLCNSYGMQFRPFRNCVPQSITPLPVAGATDATR